MFYSSPSLLAKTSSALHLVAAIVLRDKLTLVADLADHHGLCRSRAYQLLHKASAALCPQPPGPVPGHRALARANDRVLALEAENASLRLQLASANDRLEHSVLVDERKLEKLNLVLAHHKVSVDASAQILNLAFDGRARGPSWLAERRSALGKTARCLLDKARAQVCKSLLVVMGDDIFLHHQAIKVLMEPRSLAVLNVMRWPWHAGEDWELFLEEFSSLDLLVADLGSDLVAASNARGILHMADFFHEKRWWNDNILAPLSRLELSLRQDGKKKSKDKNKRVGSPRTSSSEAEEQFFLALQAVDELLSLYQPVRPKTGALWSDREVSLAVQRARKHLASLPGEIGEKAKKHLETYVWKYEAHRGLLDHIEVELRAGTVWTKEQVLREVVHLEQLRRHAERATDDAVCAWRRVRRLEEKLRSACKQLPRVQAAMRAYREVPCRSSSAVESFNNRVRVMQYVHRRVSDELLALEAIAWNLTERSEGRLAGKTPYGVLGVDLGQEGRAWYDVVLDAERKAA